MGGLAAMAQKDHKVSTYLFFFLYRASIQFSAEYGGDGGFAQHTEGFFSSGFPFLLALSQ